MTNNTAPSPSSPTPPAPAAANRIKTVTIEGFRSIKNVARLELPQLGVLIGGNGTGKSNLIRFFEMVSFMLTAKNLQGFVARYGGGDDLLFMGARTTPRLHAEVSIETQQGCNDYSFDLVHVANDTLVVTHEAYRFSDFNHPDPAHWTGLDAIGKESSLPEQQNRTARTILSLLRSCSTYHFHETSLKAPIHMSWDITDCVHLRDDGGNLAAVLLDLRENDRKRYDLIVAQIRRVLPTFKDFILEPVHGKVLLRWVGQYSDKVFGSHLTSDGSLRLFCLITLLNLPIERLPNVLLFDEPELGLHPHAMTLIAAMFKRVARYRQVIVATQSPYLVDCFDLDNIIIVRAPNGESQFHKLSRKEYQSWLEDDYLPSDIWLKESVGG
ncbi:AAA family ATPase [Allochromatium tepidum]|uniref:Chromosome segregation protein SMC n=1 Tax=Allochromatium tepidum TaxID=553982 RepID=A0ABM7QQQ0_9GAMM|nr:AAA family ATPase [Allochromatium tepidum]BCU08297.1 chromosome segregation protein SMC [Allochromatium tepidum]